MIVCSQALGLVEIVAVNGHVQTKQLQEKTKPDRSEDLRYDPKVLLFVPKIPCNDNNDQYHLYFAFFFISYHH